MKRILLIAALGAASVTAAGCSSDNKVLRGAGIGAAGGAVVGAVVPGIDPVTGAAIGAAGGAVVGALDKDGRRWYRDRDGREYWIDKDGDRRYR